MHGERASPPTWSGVPTRRLRSKTTVPAISMVYIEGEDQGQTNPKSGSDSCYHVPEWLQPHFELESVTGSDEESWSLKTDSEETSASSHDRTPSMQSDIEEPGGGDVEEAPIPGWWRTPGGLKHDRDGGAPVSSQQLD